MWKLFRARSLLELAITELEASESYQLIQAIDDKQAYFEQLKIQLEEEYRYLEQELNGHY